jgi:anti-sigma B factor antagonist
MDYQIDHDPIERGHLIVASGELDIAATPRLSTVLAMASARPGGRLVLDLSDVAFIDSSGLAVIVEADEFMRQKHRRLAVVAPRGTTAAVLLTLAGLRRRLNVFESRATARRE